MKCDRRWEVTNKCIYNKYILCSKTVYEFSLCGTYVGILGYVVGRIYLLQLIKSHTEENGHEIDQHF